MPRMLASTIEPMNIDALPRLMANTASLAPLSSKSPVYMLSILPPLSSIPSAYYALSWVGTIGHWPYFIGMLELVCLY